VSTTPVINYTENLALVVDIGDKLITGVNDTGDLFSTDVRDTGDKFIAGFLDTGGEKVESISVRLSL